MKYIFQCSKICPHCPSSQVFSIDFSFLHTVGADRGLHNPVRTYFHGVNKPTTETLHIIWTNLTATLAIKSCCCMCKRISMYNKIQDIFTQGAIPKTVPPIRRQEADQCAIS